MRSCLSSPEKKQAKGHISWLSPLGKEVGSHLVSFCRVSAQRHRAHLESLVPLEQVFSCLWSHWGPDPHTHLLGRDCVTVQ